jgi:hypothetical protein
MQIKPLFKVYWAGEHPKPKKVFHREPSNNDNKLATGAEITASIEG